MKHHVIYVPGIRDDLFKLQSTALRSWWLWGVRAHCHEFPWSGTESYQVKFDRLLADIDRHAAQGHTVSLVGASAGATAVLHAFAARKTKIKAVIFICGKINRPAGVSPLTYAENPAFRTAMTNLSDFITRLEPADKAKMLSLYSPVDRVVPHADSNITGVTEHELPALSHGRAIIYSITIGARRIIRYLKRPG